MSTCAAEVAWQKVEAINMVRNAICSGQFTAAKMFSHMSVIIVMLAMFN